MNETQLIIARLRESLLNAIEAAGCEISGPTNPDVAEDEGQPRWLAYARQAYIEAIGHS